MSDPERFVAYYRMPAIGMTLSGVSLPRQRQAIATFLEAENRILVGEFTEIMAPSLEGEIPPAFQLALDCCLTLDAALVAVPDGPVLGDVEQALASRRNVVLRLLGIPDGAGSPPASHQFSQSDDAPYLKLRPRVRPPVPLRNRAPVGNRAKADAFARAILPIIEQIRESGATTLTDIARELNARHVRTARGRRWYPMTVRNILRRDRDL